MLCVTPVYDAVYTIGCGRPHRYHRPIRPLLPCGAAVASSSGTSDTGNKLGPPTVRSPHGSADARFGVRGRDAADEARRPPPARSESYCTT